MASPTLYNTSRDHLMRKLRERETQMKSEIVPLNQIKLIKDSRFSILDQEVFFPEEVMKVFVSKIGGIPLPYYFRASDDFALQSRMIEHGIQQVYALHEKSEDEPVITITRHGEKVLGVPNVRKPIVPLTSVVRAAEAGVGKGVSLDRWRLGDDGLTVSFTSEESAVEPRVGDITRGGIEVFFSDGYVRNPEMHYFAYRLVCSNGMILPVEGQRFSIVGETVDEIIMEIEAKAQELMGGVGESLINPFAATVNHEVGDVGSFVNKLAKDFGLRNRVRNRLMARALSELTQPVTQYDVINLLTSIQHDATLPENDRVAVQVAGALEAHNHDRHCPTCHGVLN